MCQIWHNPEPSEKRGRVLLKACGDELLSHIVPLEIDWHENKPWRKCDLSFGQALAFPCLRRGVVHLILAPCTPIPSAELDTSWSSGNQLGGSVVLADATGALAIDTAFHDANGRPGFDFANREWPQGWKGSGVPPRAAFPAKVYKLAKLFFSLT